MEPGLALAYRSRLTVAPRLELRSDATCGTALVSMVMVAFLMALLPLSSALCLAGFGASVACLAAIPWPRSPATVLPEDLADPVARETYRAILAARSELERALADAPGLASTAPSLSERCSAAVRLCARIALVGNRSYAYLSSNDNSRVARDATHLRAKLAATRDESTARDLANAAAACERQLAACEQLEQTRGRIQARLELVLASLRSFTASVVKQQTTEDEQLTLAGESLSEQVDGVGQELAVLEAALEVDAAA